MNSIESEEVLNAYISEMQLLIDMLKNATANYGKILRLLSMTKDISRLLGFLPIYKMCKALESLYKALCDKNVLFTENIKILIKTIADKLEDLLQIIQSPDDSLEDADIHSFLLYCDKAAAGEIFNASFLTKKPNYVPIKHKIEKIEQKDEIIKLHSKEIAKIVNVHEEMIARTYIISNQIEILKNALIDKNYKVISDTYKLLAADSQNLQNSLLTAHDQFLGLINDDTFLQNHQDFQGFFVFANEQKYLIPAEFIFDIICESSLNYVTKSNQKFVVYIQEDEKGTDESEELPVYSLSSLLPGQKIKKQAALDTILLVDYQSQRLGIIVDVVQKFVSVLKKPMPSAFENFPILQGVAFDEKYDMIPILYLPEIMKKFRALRGYDVKKYEANTKKHINKILIVDDSKTTREIENTILSGNGFLVEEAFDGIDAMEKIHDKQFDLIVCDDAMPRMNGEILLDNLRRMENYANVPVLAMGEKPLEKADAFISKSDFKRDTLIYKIKELLHE
ncbi:MAG: response regulator [Treponema sp.]|nr:response regulator [Treponema sp.]